MVSGRRYYQVDKVGSPIYPGNDNGLGRDDERYDAVGGGWVYSKMRKEKRGMREDVHLRHRAEPEEADSDRCLVDGLIVTVHPVRLGIRCRLLLVSQDAGDAFDSLPRDSHGSADESLAVADVSVTADLRFR